MTSSVSEPMFSEILNSAVRHHIKEVTATRTLPKDVYCRRFNTTTAAISMRLKKGIWQMGNQVLRVPGAGDFIDLDAVDEWVLKEGKSCR